MLIVSLTAINEKPQDKHVHLIDDAILSAIIFYSHELLRLNPELPIELKEKGSFDQKLD